MPVLTATAEPAHSPPRVAVRVEWGAATNVHLSRRDTDKSRPVRGCEPLTLTAGGLTQVVYDYEAPFGMPVRYEAYGNDKGRAVSAAATLNPTAWYPNDLGWSTERGAVWLRHLFIPRLSMPIDLSNADSPSFKQIRTVTDVLDRREPIVLSDARRKALTSTLEIRTWSLEESARLRKLLADNSVLLLSVPAGERWGLTHHYVAVGDVTEQRLIQEWAPFEGRVFQLPVEIVTRPVGGVIYSDCSYWGEQDEVPSYFAFDVKYPTYAGLAACNVNAVAPPDPPDPIPPDPGDDGDLPTQTFTELAKVSSADGQGTYGSIQTTYTQGTQRTFVDLGSSNKVLAATPIPLLLATITVNAVTAKQYEFDGQLNAVRADQTGQIGLQVRVTPGASATATSGTLVTQGPFTSVNAGASQAFITMGGISALYSPGTAGTYTFALVLVGQGGTTSVSTATEYGGTSAAQFPCYSREVTASTTVVPAKDVTLSLTANVTGGTTYIVSAEQWLKNAEREVKLSSRYQYGTQTGPTIGLVVGSSSNATLGSTAVLMQANGTFSATSSGVITLVLAVTSDYPVGDGTSGTQPRSLSIGYMA